MTVSTMPLPIWWEHLSHRAEELLRLSAGWDSYEGSTVSPISVEAMFRFLGRFMADDLPTPQLTPTSVGGVNVEWHLGDHREIEVEFYGEGDMEALIVIGEEESEFPRGSAATAVAEVVGGLLRGG